MSETTPEDHLIILRELLAGNKTLAMSTSIRAQVNGSRVRVNCSCMSVKLHLSYTVLLFVCYIRSYVVKATSTIPDKKSYDLIKLVQEAFQQLLKFCLAEHQYHTGEV